MCPVMPQNAKIRQEKNFILATTRSQCCDINTDVIERTWGDYKLVKQQHSEYSVKVFCI